MSFEEILEKCQKNPNFLYSSTREICSCEYSINNNHAISIPIFTISEIKKLIKLKYINPSKNFQGNTFHRWCVEADAFDKHSTSHLVDIFLLFLENSNNIIEIRYKFEEGDWPSSVITSFYSCATFSKEYAPKLFFSFLNEGFNFSQEYWTLWCAVSACDVTIVNFLLTNGMKIEDCLQKTEEGIFTDNIEKSCIGFSLKENFNKLIPINNEICDINLFRQINILCQELLDRNFPKDIIDIYKNETKNPYWIW